MQAVAPSRKMPLTKERTDMAKVNYALIEAAAKNDIDKLDAALELGAEVDCRYQGFTPLYLAVMKGFTKVAHRLLLRGANVEAMCNKRRTAIMIAASRGRLMCVELLLDHHANVHRQDEGGETAKQLALRNGHEGVAALLQDAEYATLPRNSRLMALSLA
ncbi:hypothetical protein H310_02138 [Aphanomyces invadans]|uniref:Uncharacterized protein n=1 Tax=Aphanomyces invadans TaxID=157072 RepID=A0A024UNB5_9STRA|nr:hypothetical protein H310_02138 [Aphanomyces invadans]ETW07680.1 hypothetical protein H310_02138 [Aphanomyces invadans]|eukprot:XP_008863773.1 hypothetical protein H310_02138 [Aphanomyces invadans]